jgi:hypothetical protein
MVSLNVVIAVSDATRVLTSANTAISSSMRRIENDPGQDLGAPAQPSITRSTKHGLCVMLIVWSRQQHPPPHP